MEEMQRNIMLKKASLFLLITVAMAVLLPGVGLSKSVSRNWATIDYPEQDQSVPYDPVRIVIQLDAGANPKSFKAKLNRTNVTDRFIYDDYRNRLTATLGSEDGLNVGEDNGRNTLETQIKGDRSGKRKKDRDSRMFYVLDEPLPTRWDVACLALPSLQLPDVTIESAVFSGENGLHCHVLGTIETEIRFEVRLPYVWNGKFHMGGGGGLVGSIRSWGWEDALRRGYATAGTDTGHEGLSLVDASPFLDNWERIVNWGYRAIHLTTANAKIITRIFYDEDILFSYFSGCSNGGRQGMMESQRHPKEFDGILVGAPGFDIMKLFRVKEPDPSARYINEAMFPIGQALDDPVLPVSKLPLIDEAVVANCDHEDGVMDGLIDDPRNCSFDHWDLQCSGETGEDPSTCLTEDELLLLDMLYRPFVGDTGEELLGKPYGLVGWDSAHVYNPEVLDRLGFPNNAYNWVQGFRRYLIYNDPTLGLHDPVRNGYDQRLLDLSEVIDADNKDLSEFRDNGGKMIIWHGWSDPEANILNTITYYEEAEANKANAKRGKEDIRDFNRLFLLPGVAHCGGGPGPGTNWGPDFLSPLEDWVEEGIAPESIIAYGGAVPGRTRPLCPYPQVAVWDGVNDSDDAGSFACQEP
jgi:feruloyl esterase